MTSILLVGLLIVNLSYQRSTPDSDFYTAVVVEYMSQDPINVDDPSLMKNSKAYVSYIERAGKEEADIIVFPEDGLTSIHVPSREKMPSWSTLIPLNYIPCNQIRPVVHEALSLISCAAQNAKIYVVINIAEKMPCNRQTCPGDRVLYYNSQVIFDRNGKIIAKYRKTNLFSEPMFNVTTEPEHVVFNTDFGVTFGTFICFDILFKEPGISLTRDLNITDIIYSAAWFSELPFLTALQTQYGWSYAEDVNLLASGYNRVQFGNGGSGIYLGRNGICEALDIKSGDAFISCKVPKKNRTVNFAAINEAMQDLVTKRNVYTAKHVHDELRKREATDVQVWQESDMALYKSISFNGSVLGETLCDGNFCCVFEIEASHVDSNSVYKLIAFNGIRKFPNQDVTVGVQACALVRCANESITSCGVRLNSQTTFNTIKINATFSDLKETIIMPSSVDVNMLPLTNWTYKEHFNGQQVLIAASLDSEPVKDLLTCGLFARVFSRDVKFPVTILDILTAIQITVIVAMVIILILFFYWLRNGWKWPSRRSNENIETEQYHTLRASNT